MVVDSSVFEIMLVRKNEHTLRELATYAILIGCYLSYVYIYRERESLTIK